MSPARASHAMPSLQRRLADVLNHPPQGLGPQATLREAAGLMAQHHLPFLPVLDDAGRPLGQVSEQQLLQALREPGGADQPLQAWMQPVTSLPADCTLEAAWQRVQTQAHTQLVLVDDTGRMVGLLTDTDLRSVFKLGLLANQPRVSAVMMPAHQCLAVEHTLGDAVACMGPLADTALVLTEQGRAVGVLTTQDVARLVGLHSADPSLPLRQVMSTPVLSVAAQASLNDAADLMLAHRVRHLVVLDDKGAPVGLVGAHQLTRDLGHQFTEQALTQQRSHQLAMLQAIPDVLWLKDPDGHYLLCNPRFEQLVGRTQAEVLGCTDADLVPAEAAERYRQADLQTLASAQPVQWVEAQRFEADGHVEWLQTTKSAVRDAQGQLIGVLGIGRDVTRQQQVEEEFRHLFARNPAPMLIYQRGSLRLLRVNEAFVQQYGYSHAEATELLLSDLYPPEDRTALRQKAASLRGLAHVGAWRHLRKDGSLLHVVANSHDVVLDGHEGRIAVFTDITAIARSQQRERHRLGLLEQLVRGEASLTELLEGLAREHEALFPLSLCSVLLTRDQQLHHAAAPSLPADYCAQLNGVPVDSHNGGCSAAAATGQRVVVDDIATYPQFLMCRDLALATGLASCWSEPILGAAGQVLGTFAVYRRSPGRLDEDEASHLAFSVQLAATAISRWTTAQQLRDNERQLSDILHAIPDLIWLRHPNGHLTACNAAFERLAQRPLAQLLGQRPEDVLPPTLCAALCPPLAEAQSTNLVQTRWLLPEGASSSPLPPEKLVYDLLQTPLHDANLRPTGLLSVARDVTERHRNETRIRRLNQAYAVLSGVNEAIVRLRDGPALLAEACRIMVEVGGFRLAWMGQLDASGQTVVPLAFAGHTDDYEASLRIPLHQGAQGPISRLWLSGQHQVVDDVRQDEGLTPWREAMLARGYWSMATFPIEVGGQLQHSLAVCGEAPGYFDADLVSLFKRLARDLGFALEFIRSEAAQRQEQRLREQLMEAVAGLFFALTPDGRCVLWNGQLERVTGYGPTEIRRRQVLDYFDPADQPAITQATAQVFATGQAQVEALLVSKDGRRTPYLFVSRRIDLTPEPLLVGTGIDISQRVASERELQRYREHLEALVTQRTAELEAANARLHREDLRLRAMLALSQQASTLSEAALLAQGLQTMLFLSNSPSGCLMTVDERQQGFELHVCSPTTPAPDARPDRVWNQVLQQRCSVRTEPPAEAGATEAPDASEAHHTASAAGPAQQPALGVPVLDDLDPHRLRLIACVAGRPRPYTEADERELRLIGADLWRIVRRRRTELALEQAKGAADAASQAKSAFLANMSHEIRTPMNAILGFAHLLQREPLSPRQQQQLGHIHDASQHLLQVINDILDFSKIEAHKLQLETQDFDLLPGLERVLGMLRERATAKGLRLRLHTAPALPPQLRGDRLRLEQILLNLVGNAIKFTDQGGVDVHVGLTQPPRHAGPPPSGPAPVWLRIAVHDTGIGLDPAQVGHLFEAFAQADASITRRYGGTGLGLAISQRLAQLMGGHIDVSSQPGAGSAFVVVLPFAAPRQAWPALSGDTSDPATRDALARLWLPGVRLLLVEDNPINQEVACALLGELGARVDVAEDGAQAVRLAHERPYDLVLMDMQMPVMDGLQATRLIRQMPERGHLPIIAMTANAFEEDRLQCLAAGMNDYLAKPVEPLALRHCLLRWLAPHARPQRRPLPQEPAP